MEKLTVNFFYRINLRLPWKPYRKLMSPSLKFLDAKTSPLSHIPTSCLNLEPVTPAEWSCVHILSFISLGFFFSYIFVTKLFVIAEAGTADR